jgi:hypothetical protein
VVGLLPHFLDLEHLRMVLVVDRLFSLLVSILIQIPTESSKVVTGNKIKAIISLKSNLEILSKLAMVITRYFFFLMFIFRRLKILRTLCYNRSNLISTILRSRVPRKRLTR